MSISRYFPKNRSTLAHSTVAAFVLALLYGLSVVSSKAQLISQETFNDDGEKANPPRYVVTGRDVYTPDRIKAEVDPATQQVGMAFWAHNFDLPAYADVPAKFVGVPGATPARRALLACTRYAKPAMCCARRGC